MNSVPIEVAVIEQSFANMQAASRQVPIPAAGNTSFATSLTQATNDLTSGGDSPVTGGSLLVGLTLTQFGANSTENLVSPPAAFAWPWNTQTPAPSSASPGARTAKIEVSAPVPTLSGAVSGSDVVNMAARFQGTPYVWGGTSPQGFDCSGFVQYVFGRLGINLPRTSEQQALVGTSISSVTGAQPGDLLFFAGSDGTSRAPGHVAIYLGNGEMIDAPYTGTTVRVEPLSSAGPVVAIRRVIGQVA